jgi:hypothetical protein
MERVIYTHIYTQRIAKEIHALHMLHFNRVTIYISILTVYLFLSQDKFSKFAFINLVRYKKYRKLQFNNF